MIYIAATIISMLFSYTAKNLYNMKDARNESKGTIQKFFIFLSCIPLAFISAFRFKVGADYMSYYYIYSGIRLGSELEPGFRFFNKILHFFSDNPYFFFAVTSIITCGIYFFSIYKYSINPAYSILLFLLSRDYIQSLSLVRQYMAIAVMLLAIPYILEKKWINVVIITAIAASFHITALIVIPLYILYCIKLTPKKSIVILGILFVCLGSLYAFAQWLSLEFFSITDKTYYFIEGSIQNKVSFATSYFLIYAVVFVFFTLIYKAVEKNQIMQLAYSASFIGLIIALSTFILPSTFDRFTYYLSPIFIIYIPEIVEKFPYKKYKHLLNIAIIVGYTAWYVNLIYFQEHVFLPYQFIF